MGLGGYLTWTALAREIFERTGSKIVPIESHGNMIKLVCSPAFKNNPHIVQDFSCDGNTMVFPIALNNPLANYCDIDTPQRAQHKSDKHIIETLCSAFGIKNPRIKCELFLTNQELDEASKILENKGIKSNFVCIEPVSKTNYTVNRQYDFAKWQKVVNEVSDEVDIVQLGVPGSPELDGVFSLVGETSFRTAAAIISKSKALLSSEGGLVHVANAVDTPAVVVLTGYQTKKMVSYNSHTYINISSHGPCGLKSRCKKCEMDTERHDPHEIIRACKEILQK